MKLVDILGKKDNDYELKTNSKIKKIRHFNRGISDFKKGYQPRTNIVKDEKVDNNFSNLLNLHAVIGVKQTEILTSDPLVPEPSVLSLRWLLKS